MQVPLGSWTATDRLENCCLKRTRHLERWGRLGLRGRKVRFLLRVGARCAEAKRLRNFIRLARKGGRSGHRQLRCWAVIQQRNGGIQCQISGRCPLVQLRLRAGCPSIPHSIDNQLGNRSTRTQDRP